MSDRDKKKKLPSKNYSLISAQIRLHKSQEEEEIQNALFDRRLKGFHLFCVILFGTFIIDGQLPSESVKTFIESTKSLENEKKDIVVMVDGKPVKKEVIVSTRMNIITGEGSFVTEDIGGFALGGEKANLRRSPLFKVPGQVYVPKYDFTASRWINFSGNMIFWPIAAFLISFVCLVTKRFHGSTTLAVIALLNIVPFFTIVYKT